jgi:hypothetical protein
LSGQQDPPLPVFQEAEIFDLVASIVGQLERRFTTPNLFTEVDNLVRSDVAEKQRADVSWVLHKLINGLEELPTPSTVLVQHDFYGKIGLADCSILAVPDVLVLTDDLPLSSFLSNAGRAVINVSHLIAQ